MKLFCLLTAAALFASLPAGAAPLTSSSDSTGMEQRARDLLETSGSELLGNILADGLWENTTEIESRSQKLIANALEIPAAPRISSVIDAHYSRALMLEAAGDLPGAVKELRSAAAGGSAYAQARLADYYHYGRYVRRDRTKAMWWLQRSAAAGNSLAARRIAEMLLHTNEGLISPGYRTALHWYARAAEMGDVNSMLELARFSLKPLTDREKPNATAAAEWYTKAASLGNQKAQLALAEIFSSGILGEPDYRSARHELVRAAGNGSNLARVRLSNIYEKGLGVAPDLVKAYALLESIPEKARNETIRERASRLEKKLFGNELRQAKALAQTLSVPFASEVLERDIKHD
jgi:TPR repeat protein